MQCKYQSVVVIGCGKIAVTAMKYMVNLQKEYGFFLTFIHHEMGELAAVKKICDINNVSYVSLPDKKDVTKKLLSYETDTLIISAGNYYLFPAKLLEKEHITAINFHNALLPKYPGRNAPSWAMYYGEKESGATWHMVTKDIDSGGIIWQGVCDITDDMKAYELTAKIMELAQEGLESFLPDLLTGNVLLQAQPKLENRVMYYAKDIPANGEISYTDDTFYIYKVLRAMDYGKMGPFPPTVMKLRDGKKTEVLRYKKKQKNMCEEADNQYPYISLSMDDEWTLVIKYKEME